MEPVLYSYILTTLKAKGDGWVNKTTRGTIEVFKGASRDEVLDVILKGNGLQSYPIVFFSLKKDRLF